MHHGPDNLVPADGMFISGHNVRCDMSFVTSESDQKKKILGVEVLAQIEARASFDKLNLFIISDSKVLLEGAGTYLVTGVGVYSSYRKLIVAMTDDHEETPAPLQGKLSVMAEQITKFGCAVALLLFVEHFAKIPCPSEIDQGTPAEKA